MTPAAADNGSLTSLRRSCGGRSRRVLTDVAAVGRRGSIDCGVLLQRRV